MEHWTMHAMLMIFNPHTLPLIRSKRRETMSSRHSREALGTRGARAEGVGSQLPLLLLLLPALASPLSRTRNNHRVTKRNTRNSFISRWRQRRRLQWPRLEVKDQMLPPTPPRPPKWAETATIVWLLPLYRKRWLHHLQLVCVIQLMWPSRKFKS